MASAWTLQAGDSWALVRYNSLPAPHIFPLCSAVMGCAPSSPAVPGPTLETFVGADINTILITNLLSGMDYSVKIFASQAAGFSDALTGLVKTRKTASTSAQD